MCVQDNATTWEAVSECIVRNVIVRNIATVNSLMFAGINVCVCKAKTCSWGLLFAVSSVPVSYLVYMNCLRGIKFCNLKMVAKFAK